MSTDVVAALPTGLSTVYVAAYADRIAAITTDRDGVLELVQIEGTRLHRAPWRHGDVVRVALARHGLYVLTRTSLLRVGEDGSVETIASPESLTFDAIDRGVVFPRNEGITLRSPDGATRELVQIAPGPREIDLVERSGKTARVLADDQGRFEREGRRWKASFASHFGMVGLGSIAAVESGVAGVTVGGPEALQEVRFVPWEGGEATCILREPDATSPNGDTQRLLGPVVAHGATLALVTGLGREWHRISTEVWLLDPPSWKPRRLPVSGTSRSTLASDGKHLVLVRAIEGQKLAIDLLVGETWVALALDATSVDVACTSRGVIYGRGAEIVRVPWSVAADAPRAAVAALLDAIRAAGGAFEKTSVGGKPAIKITRTDGSRQIKPVSAEDLADLERRLAGV